MRKVLVVLALAAVVAATATIYIIRQYGLADPAAICPANTTSIVAIPDLLTTIGKWRKTALAQIGAEPEMKAFLERPARAAGARGGDEAISLIKSLKPGRAFFAITGVSKAGVDMLLGIQYFGERKALDAAFERMYAQLAQAAPAGQRESFDYDGDVVTQFSAGQYVLVTAAHGKWAFLANRREVIEAALDRTARRNTEPSLAADELFNRIRKNLPAEPDLFWVVRPQRILDTLIEIGKESNARPIDWQIDQLRKLEGLGGSLQFEGADMVETVFSLMSKKGIFPAIDRRIMPLSTPQTAILADLGLDVSLITEKRYWDSLPPQTAVTLEGLGITPEALSTTLGEELGLIMNWPAGSMIPGGVLALAIKDHARAAQIVRSIVAMVAPDSAPIELNRVQVFGFPQRSQQLADPMVGVSQDFVFVTSNSAEMERVASAKPGAQTLEHATAFKSAAEAYRDARNGFAYLDTRAIFERIYNPLRPVIILGASMTPKISTFLDPDKLPSTEAISKHLSPITYVHNETPDGYLVVSRGPLTLNQVLLLVGAGVGASFGARSILR